MATTINKDLATTLTAARGGKMVPFTFFPKGKSGKLLAGRANTIKQINETKKATGVAAVLLGRCFGEDGKLVFEVNKPPADTLFDQIKSCLKNEAGLTFAFEIRVNAAMQAAPADGAGNDGVPPPPPAPGDEGLRNQVAQRLSMMGDAIKAALTGPEAARVKTLFVSANELIKSGDLDGAARILDELAPLLVAPAALKAEPAPTTAPDVALTQCRLLWDKARKKLQADLEQIEKAILAACTEEEGYDDEEVGEGVKEIYAILDVLDERLGNALDAAVNEADPARRQQFRALAADAARDYLSFVESDALMKAIDESGFVPTKPGQTAATVLKALTTRL